MDKNKSPSGLKKIESLLKQMGISEEATAEFTGVCEAWHREEKAKLDQQFKVRLEKAKRLCVEEVEDHKASLSRGVKMFLESQGETIRKASEKQAAIAESDAVDLLNKIAGLVGKTNVGSAETAQTVQAESKKNAELVSQLAELQESLEREKAKSAKLGELSEKSLTRQKDLEKSLTESKSLLSEARDQLRKGKKQAFTLSENKVKAGKTVTKRPVLSESDKGKKPEAAESKDQIDLIAESLD